MNIPLPEKLPPVGNDFVGVINYALSTHPESVRIVPFTALVRKVSVKTRRPNTPGHRPGLEQFGRLLADVPASVARNLQGPAEERDFMVLIHVSRVVADEAMDPPKIILP